MEDKKDLFKCILMSDLDDNISIYKNLGYHISQLKKDQIVKDESLIDMLEILEDIFSVIKLAQFKIEEDYFIGSEEFKIYNSNLLEIRERLKRIVLTIGYNQIYEIFKLCMDTYNFEKHKTTIESEIEFIDKYFTINKIECEEFVDSDLSINFKENSDPIITPSLTYQLGCATMEVNIGLYKFKFDGYFRPDSLNSLFREKLFESKYNKLNKGVNLLNIPYKFKHGYLQQLTYADFVTKKPEKIIEMIDLDYAELKKISKTLISNLVTDFTRMETSKQRKIIILLLLSKEEDAIAANVLFETVRLKEMRDTFHWSIRKLLIESSNQKIVARRKLLCLEPNEMTYEEKLIILKTTEKNKAKALSKVKELNSSRESASKAETYLNGFFKIPFGVYKEEHIFNLNSSLKNKYSNIINLINISKSIPQKFKTITKFKFDILPNIKIVSNFIEAIDDLDDDIDEELDEIKKLSIDLHDTMIRVQEEKYEYLQCVKKTLDSAIYGQTDVKKQIEVIIAQWMNGKAEGAVIGLQGPPGTGKTQIAREGIAKCIKDQDGTTRPFCFVPLGGARDGSVLEGHNYTYLGSQWGKLVDLLMDSKCMNPIIFFDEVDKVSTTPHGQDIINILIHLTDPTQNKEIYDKYFAGVELDFSKCLFIFSYNDPQLIDRVLRDRITEIKVKPLKIEEKIKIVTDYTIPQICENVGIDSSAITFSESSIKYLISTYTFEAGMRKCIEKLKEIFRVCNYEQIENNTFNNIIINKELIDRILKSHNKISHKQIHSNPKIGLINGLYATAVGIGGITIIQVIKTWSDKKLGLELTGQQGAVMKESMVCAKTLAWNLLTNQEKQTVREEMDGPGGSFGFHIHCPECATPKDGPSAGIAITTAIYSVLTFRPIKNYIAMTGEVDLIGNVKAIGGLDAKIAGAIQAGCTQVLVPKENEQDYEKLSQQIKDSIEIILVDNIQQVLDYSLV